MGRFISADGIVGANQDMLGNNLYAYVSNNPIMNSDPTGEFAITIPLLIEGAKWIIGGYVAYKICEATADALRDTDWELPKWGLPKINIKTKEKTKTKVKPITITKTPEVPKNNKPCTTATLVGGDVSRGKRLTVVESQIYIKMGGNIMCNNHNDAFLVAIIFPEKVGPEIDLHQKPGNVYYYHYHPDRDSHRHIWFYGTP